MKFKHLTLNNWRQFDDVQIAFHDRLTVLTGANGAGKTTILNLLARHFGWSINLIGTLTITRRGAWRYFSGVNQATLDEDVAQQASVGKLIYTNNTGSNLTVPTQVGEHFNVKIENQQSIEGIYITSHRPVYSYQRVDNIPTKVQANEELFNQYINTLRQYYNPNARIESPSFRLKSSLISLATFGYGNQAVKGNDDARRTFETFQDILRQVLPPDLEFRRISIRLPDVILECENTEFSLDAASGGIAALIDLSWQIHMRSRTSDSFVVILDEPENHLHPRLQRTVLPGLIDAFPSAQFVAATHNPFVVSSVANSVVVVLDFHEGKVRSSDLSRVEKAASANEILMEVLGVPFPMPLWVEDEVERVVGSLEGVDLTTEVLSDVRSRLSDLGLGEMFPEVVDRLISRTDSRK